MEYYKKFYGELSNRLNIRATSGLSTTASVALVTARQRDVNNPACKRRFPGYIRACMVLEGTRSHQRLVHTVIIKIINW